MVAAGITGKVHWPKCCSLSTFVRQELEPFSQKRARRPEKPLQQMPKLKQSVRNFILLLVGFSKRSMKPENSTNCCLSAPWGWHSGAGWIRNCLLIRQGVNRSVNSSGRPPSSF